MIIRGLAALDPRMQPGAAKYILRLSQEGIPYVVLETRRELSTQMAYRARGFAPVWLVKEYFAACGLWAISDAEAAKINTKTMKSKHLDGLAMDIAPAKTGEPWWGAPRELWLRMFAIAEDECGLDACADGKFQRWQWDWPHHEFREEVV
jgi:hypothetical protein